jgi:general secretion pathway protein K
VTAELSAAAHAVGAQFGGQVHRDQRGVALMIVMFNVVLFGLFATEFAYRSRVTLYVASNLRRDMQAHYHARSAIEIARMVIRSQNLASQLMGGMGGNIELWKYACKFAEIYNTGKLDFNGLEIADLSEQEGIGVKKGGFECEVIAEDGRVNVNDADNQAGKQRIFSALFGYIRGPEADPGRFSNDDRENAEVLLNVMDWSDGDQTGTDLDPNFNILDAGGQSEDFVYSKYEYEPKNSKFDSIEEVKLVEGMTDEVFCKVRDQITVYSTDKLNVNAADVRLLEALVCQLMDPQMRLLLCGGSGAAGGVAPIAAVGQVIEQCRTIKELFFAPLFRNMQDFQGFFQGIGQLPSLAGVAIPVPPGLNQIIGFRGRVIRVKALGEVDGTEKRISAVIDTRTGKYVYWGTK